MKISIPGVIVYLFLIIITLVAVPLYMISLAHWAKSETEMMSETAELIDKVIDTRTLTEDMLADFNLDLASKELNYKATIYREVKVVNPDPTQAGKTYTAYVLADDITTWEQGDNIVVEVESVGESKFTTLAARLMGLHVGDSKFTLSGRVR